MDRIVCNTRDESCCLSAAGDRCGHNFAPQVSDGMILWASSSIWRTQNRPPGQDRALPVLLHEQCVLKLRYHVLGIAPHSAKNRTRPP